MNNCNTNKEVWKDIKDYEDQYMISNFGRIYSKPYRRIKKATTRKDGYCVSVLYKNNKSKNVYIHRLVAEHFSDSAHKETINHIDGDKSNNHISNLEWNTYAENNKHARETGLNTTKHKRNKKGSIQIEQWSKTGELIKIYPSMRQAERETGVTATSIGIGIRNNWQYGGFVWKSHNKQTASDI